MSRFCLPRDIYHGKGCLEELKNLKGKKAILVVGGGSMKRQGFLDKAVNYLKEGGMEVQLFEGVEPDPSVETVMKGAEAMRAFSVADENVDLNLVLKVLNANNTIPVIVSDAEGNIQTYRNIEIASNDSVAFLYKQLERFKQNGSVIRINLSSGSDYNDVYYQDSLMLTRLSVYPYVQLGVVLIFVLVAIFALLSSKKAEQNKVWSVCPKRRLISWEHLFLL